MANKIIEKIEDSKSNENNELGVEGIRDEKNDSKNVKKKRTVRTVPTLSYEDSLVIGNAIQQFASGQKIRRITLFDHLEKSPESSQSRILITSSSKYKITTGGYQADYIELTPDGFIATDPDENPIKRLKANFDLAIGSNEYFLSLYNQYKDMKIPSKTVMVDFLAEQEIDQEDCVNCVELFIINAKYIGLIKVMSGSERILTLEQVIEELSSKNTGSKSNHKEEAKIVSSVTVSSAAHSSTTQGDTDRWEKTCFYITPIGEDGSEERSHADLFLGSIIEPALEEFGFSVVRADKISTPGMITAQILELIVNSKLVIADLSFHNPNVFYELSLRHSLNLPAIHLIRKCDKIPFDINNFRTIVIDTSSIYTLVPQLETYKTSVAMQVRQLLNNPETSENPISAFMGKIKKNIDIKKA